MMRQTASRRSRAWSVWSVVAGVFAAGGGWCLGLPPAIAQELIRSPVTVVQERDPELMARESVTDIGSLVDEQRIEAARRIMRQYPNTEVARIAERLLREYEQYEALEQAERARQELERQQIRAFWNARRTLPPPPAPRAIVITNRTEEPVMYQVRLPGTEWMGPYQIAAGASHRFNHSAMYRQVTAGGVVHHQLEANRSYLLLPHPETGDVQLFLAP